MRHASTGKHEAALLDLAAIDDHALREWFVEHGQMSWYHRWRVLGEPDPEGTPNREAAEQRKITKEHADEVFVRDGYRCRYCGIRVVPKQVFAQAERILGAGAFRATGTNAQRHGIVLCFRANVDHVWPCKLGGSSNLENLATACWCCNYGKESKTLKQLGLDHPLERPPIKDGWNGLTELLPGLQSQKAGPRG
jgi:5-methylcytosine-specific restriction endonuclease McrA